MGNHVVFRSPSLTGPGGQATPQGFVDNLLEGKVQEPGPLAKGAGYVIVQSKCRSHNSILMPTIFDVKTGTVSSGPCGRIDASDNCRYPALMEVRTLLIQPAPPDDAPMSRGDQVRQAARARNTRRAYHGHWSRFLVWAREQGLQPPRGPGGGPGGRPVGLPGPPGGGWEANGHHPAGPGGHRQGGGPDGVAEARRPRRRGDGAGTGPAPPGTPEAGGSPPRRGLGGHPRHRFHPPPDQGRSHRDGRERPPAGAGGRCPGLRPTGRAAGVSEAAALRWEDVELAGDGSGRIRIAESKGDQEGEGAVLYLGSTAVEALLAIRPEEALVDAQTLVFGLHPDTIRRRLQQAARAAGLPDWRDITGHSGRVGMSQDLAAAGFSLPELMTAGRWKSPRMPARYTERQEAGRGAVARYYQQG